MQAAIRRSAERVIVHEPSFAPMVGGAEVVPHGLEASPVIPREQARAELARARSLEPSQRLLALATLLARIAPDPAPGLHPASTPERPQASDPSSADWQRLRGDLRGALYRPNPTLDLDRVDADILRLLADVRG
jgi:hypothetical protein